MKKFLSLALALVMTMSLVTISAGAKDFTDNSKIAYGDAVKVMSAIEVVDGYAGGDFRPTNTLTRGAAAKIICNMVLGPTTAGALPTSVAPFKDVPAGSTFAGYIAYCSQQGIINGYADGTFRPSGTLNGYAFMKMLLGALGYDGSIEGFTGANWSVNVAKLAVGIGLDSGLTDGFNGSKAVTREEACLYAFNTLQADMVEYENTGSSITVGGVEIVTKPSKATAVTTTVKSDAIKAETGGTYVVQFGERYFKDLEKVGGQTDAFDRPATKWVYDDETITTVADKADASFTVAVEEQDLYKALNISSAASNQFDIYVDGDRVASDVSFGKNSDDELVDAYSNEISGRGILVEAFYDKDDDGATPTYNRVVVINTYVDQIDNVDTNKDDERYVEIGSYTYLTEEFEEDDMVLYTKDATIGVADDEVIKSMAPAEKLTGELTKISGSKYTIDGTVYELSESDGADLNSNGDVDVKDIVDFYLDSYGYIVKIDEAEDNATLDNLALVLSAGSDRTDYAKLLFADGKTKTVDVTKSATAMIGDVVTYKADDDGVYKLNAVGAKQKDTTEDQFDKGDTRMGSVALDSKTVFVYVIDTDNSDGSGDLDYNVYTSYKSAPSFDVDVHSNPDATVTAYQSTGASAAKLVFVRLNEEDLNSSTADLTFLAATEDAAQVNEGDGVIYYEFEAVVDGGVKTTVKIDANYFTGVGANKSLIDGVVVMNHVNYDSDNLGDGDGAVVGTDYRVANTTGKTKNDVLTLGGATYGYTSNVKVFFVKDGKISEGDVGDIKEDTLSATGKGLYENILFTLDDGEVDLVIIEKN